MSTNEIESGIKPITIQIDPSLHLAMRELAKRKQVHTSFLYGEAVEKFLDEQAKKPSKKVASGKSQ